MTKNKLTKEDLAWIHKQIRQGNYVPPLTRQETINNIEKIKEKLVICSYCGFSIRESLISSIKGEPIHDDCIKVKDWAEKKELIK